MKREKVWVVTGCLLLVLAACLVEQLMPSVRQAVAVSVSEGVELPVLMYHHLLKAEHRTGTYVITPARFEADLQYLQKKGYTTVTLTQLLDFINHGTPLPEKPILLTFDDGYESVYAYAYPLLQKYGMHAVVSIIGIYTDAFSEEGVERHLNYSHLSWDQLAEMVESGHFEVGNHSYDMHKPRGSARYGISRRTGESADDYRSALFRDVGGLNDTIHRQLDLEPILFAYPFGAGIKDSRPLLTQLGFSVFLTCEEKMNRLKPGELPLSLCRFNRSGLLGTEEFFRRLGI